MRTIKDLTPKLRKLESEDLKQDPFPATRKHPFREYRKVRSITLSRRLAFFFQSHGNRGRKLARYASRAGLEYSEWQDNPGSLPYYVYAARTHKRNLMDAIPQSMIKRIGDEFPEQGVQDDMDEAIITQAKLTRTYLLKVFAFRRNHLIPVYRTPLL